MNNRKEFLELIKRYETITLDEIEAAFKRPSIRIVARKLTGFRNPKTCSLCLAVKGDCFDCEWLRITGLTCSFCHNRLTYTAIENAKTPQELLTAYRDRAAYMRECLNNNETQWVYEDKLPEMSQEVFDKLFKYSVMRGVRIYPAYAVEFFTNE